MRQITLLTSLILLISCSKTKEELPIIRTNPEGRNQEGTQLLGTSSVQNGQLTWSTIYYEAGSNRISKEIDSSMLLDYPIDLGSEYAVTTFQYDNNGKLTRIISDTSATLFFYDEVSGLLKKRTLENDYITYEYDDKKRVVKTEVFHADINQQYLKSLFTYDDNNNIATITDWIYDSDAGGLVETPTASFIYDDKSHIFSGISQSSFWMLIPPHNTITSESKNANGASSQWNYSYIYNNAGLPKSSTRLLNGADAFTQKYYYY